MSKISKVAAGMAVVPMLAFAAPAFADSPGQLQGGSNVYLVKNVTLNGAYGSTATASACQELKYSIELHNTEFGKLSSIVVSATLPGAAATSIVSNVTATPAAGGTTGTSGMTTVTTSAAQTIAVEAGTTALYDGNAQLIRTLPDGITAGGINVGDLNGSTTEFVTFKAKTNCPPPVVPPVTPPVTPPTPPVTPPVVKPTVLVNTGPGQIIGLFLLSTVAGAFGYRTFLSRRISQN